MLEVRGACVLGAELAADESAVDRLAEDRRLPERKRLEPGERLHLAVASFAVALDELRPLGEARFRRDRRRPERCDKPVRLAVGGE